MEDEEYQRRYGKIHRGHNWAVFLRVLGIMLLIFIALGILLLGTCLMLV